MSSAFVGDKLRTIKPDDLVRTPRGRTAVCVEIRRCGFRLIRDVLTGEYSILHVNDLYLVRAATPKPWPSHLPPKALARG